MDEQQITVMRSELARWRAFGRRLDYLRSQMSAGDEAMLDALSRDSAALDGLDRYVAQEAAGAAPQHA